MRAKETSKGSSIKYVRKIFKKTNISNPLIRTNRNLEQRSGIPAGCHLSDHTLIKSFAIARNQCLTEAIFPLDRFNQSGKE